MLLQKINFNKKLVNIQILCYSKNVKMVIIYLGVIYLEKLVITGGTPLKGEVIISGNIMKGEKLAYQVKSNGHVYAETWYTVKIEVPKLKGILTKYLSDFPKKIRSLLL